MEESKKVYIRGLKGRWNEIKDILIGIGATPAECTCDDQYIYFINHKNEITLALIDTEIARVIMDNYKEIKLPQRQWKEGDILVDDSNPKSYAVFKEYEKGLAFRAYFFLCDKIVYFDTTASVTHYHRASAAEMRKIPMLFCFLLNNLDAVRKCLPRKESEK